MADWSELPTEVLHLIAKRLETCFDVIHFRSVCTSWRSSVPPKPCLLPASFQLTPFNDGKSTVSSFDLYKSIIVLIRFPKKHNQAAPDRWLVKIEEDEFEELQHWNPLSNSWITSPMLLDLLNCHVIELSQEYVVHYLPHQLQGIARYNTRKVAFMWSSTQKNDYVLLMVNCCGNFAMLRSRDKQWTILENTPRSCRDIISFNGKFYALVEEGRTMVVDPSSNVSFLAHGGFLAHVGFLADVASRTRKKFLVESAGQLLLVDQFFLPTHLMNMGFGTRSSMKQGRCSPMEMVWFKVFKLNEAGQKWEYVKSLGDHVLFLGTYGAFSASASQLSWTKGNYIFFRLNNFEPTGAEDMFAFNYENGSVKPLKNCPGFSKLFSPPPDWVTSTTQ